MFCKSLSTKALCAAGLVAGLACGVNAKPTVKSQSVPAPQRSSSFAEMYPGASVFGVRSALECGDCYWLNGGPNESKLDGQISMVNGAHYPSGPAGFEQSYAADDFCLPCGMFKVTAIEGWVISNTRENYEDAYVLLFADCDGCPDAEPDASTLDYLTGTPSQEELDDAFDTIPCGVWPLTSVVESSPITGAPGFRLMKYRFEIDDLWLKGERCYWVSIVGIEGYYDATKFTMFSTTGEVQRAAISKARSTIDDFRISDWTSSAEINLECQELAFCVEAEFCPIICDNGTYDYDGIPSQLNTTVPEARAADNFVLNPCSDYTLCYVSGYVATNCNPDNGRMCIYTNTCDTDEDDDGYVGDKPYELLECFDITKWIDTGEDTEIGGKILNIYEFQFCNLDYALPGNQNYWISIINQGTGSFNERGYFLFSYVCDRECPIKISEAQFISAGMGYPEWSPISNLTGTQHDLAFLVGGTRDDDTNAVTGCWVDINADGLVNGQDVGLFLNAYSQGCSN